MNYNHKDIEAKWQEYWAKNQTFKTENHSEKPKFYVLDMFPYPSGAGLHVGHPLGYIASDIFARYKRHKGFNVLHPQGYDSFGLPAEQYAIQTGQHPEKTTRENIARYREQLDKIGFSFDWSREVRTSNADYYKWTQWIFIQLFHSWYNNTTNKAEDIQTLVQHFEKFGTENLNAAQTEELHFTAEQWKNYSEEEKQNILLNYRLAFRAETTVNWCPALGTVLANDEVVNGVSERGGYPVFQKKMTQWSMRITAYSERLLQGLETVDWSESVKESQRNWIGKSKGAKIIFPLAPEGGTNPKSDKSSKQGYMTGGNNAHLLAEKAKDLRNNMTQAETILWEELKSKKLDDKFRRQHVIGDYIVDFVCLAKRLIVEVDGGYHNAENQQILDKERTDFLNEFGFEVIRFTNEEVIADLENVLQKIQEKLALKVDVREEISVSASVCPPSGERGIEVFTTRPDTIFGVTYLTLAPEHELVLQITTEAQKQAVLDYIEATSKRSERDRMADTKTISGVFTGAYAVCPATGYYLPIWIGDYVLAGYGTGAVMAVPAGDERDYAFAKHFVGAEGMPEIINIFDKDISENAFTEKGGFKLQNSDFLNGMDYEEATEKILEELEKTGVGKAKINYRQRDAIFSRQRYWGEPVPVYYKNGVPYTLPLSALPLELPEVEKYLPTEDGDPPLGNAKEYAWNEAEEKIVSTDLIDNQSVFPLELSTMPGWAGSSWYWLRYMDAHNEKEFASQESLNYWQNVDLYIGGSEHATGHLLYSRFWNKFLKDRGFIQAEEPFQKMINQGMILGTSAFVYRLEGTNTFISKGQIGDKKVQAIHADVSLVNTSSELDIEGFKQWRPDFADAEFILDENGKYIVGHEVEKMSKSKYNVVNPDDICEQYGADTLRLYEMFLGPLEQAKPWNTAGITGVSGFLKKFYNLYFDGDAVSISDEEPTKEEYKILHTLIKKVEYDIENFSFNTSVSAFMIAVNELQKIKCNKRAILEPMAVLISPYAPHIAEELWEVLGHNESISRVPFPTFEEKYLVESTKEYPVSFNGKVRFKIELPLDLPNEEVEKIILADERTQAQLGGNPPKKIIVVKGKIVNVVV
ncbi:Leucine--tRNA ligase [Capnocytophaga canimorsus]|uniref:Leucine--tRNA ligase n=1 Tax=Capnocytophaga canimorsus TaxID=28188 RepID=A0A0B7IIW3_9FLAO|nr:leucine--tRNA ligase [Capnocytophaga canimorsus]CEN51811.1 Leucine--tRNA ligase [Capnocytophaga canimorsus]